MSQNEVDEVKASARLPHLDIDLVHRRSPEGDAELITIHLQAMPSFRAFAQFLEATNPFLFWSRVAEAAWSPWLKLMQGPPLISSRPAADAPEDQAPDNGVTPP